MLQTRGPKLLKIYKTRKVEFVMTVILKAFGLHGSFVTSAPWQQVEVMCFYSHTCFLPAHQFPATTETGLHPQALIFPVRPEYLPNKGDMYSKCTMHSWAVYTQKNTIGDRCPGWVLSSTVKALLQHWNKNWNVLLQLPYWLDYVPPYSDLKYHSNSGWDFTRIWADFRNIVNRSKNMFQF